MMVVCFMFALGYQDPCHPAADLVKRDWKIMFMNEAKDYNKDARRMRLCAAHAV